MLEMLPETFHNHGCTESRDFVGTARASPEDPLIGRVPTVPQIGPNLRKTVCPAIFVHILNGPIMYFLGRKVDYTVGGVERNEGVLADVDTEFLDND